jgi:hypothetical protein
MRVSLSLHAYHKQMIRKQDKSISCKPVQDKRSGLRGYEPNASTCQSVRTQQKPQQQSEFTRCLSKFHAAKHQLRTLCHNLTPDPQLLSLPLSLSLSPHVQASQQCTHTPCNQLGRVARTNSEHPYSLRWLSSSILTSFSYYSMKWLPADD